MWIRFWHKGNCPSGLSQEESTYLWQDKDSSDAGLDDYAQELVPEWAKDSERGYTFGFERISKPPTAELEEQLAHYKRALVHANNMIKLLTEELKPKGT